MKGGLGNKLRLEKLTHDNSVSLNGKHLYFVKYFPSYIDEFYEVFPDAPMLEGIIEEEGAKQGEKEYKETRFWVRGSEELQKLPERSVLVITTGYFEEEYEQISQLELPRSIGDVIYYFANKDTEIYEFYLQKYSLIPLQNLIVFRSGMGTWEHIDGMDFTDNSRALFDYMVEQNLNEKYEMIWLVKYPEHYAVIEQSLANVHFVSYDWATSEDEGKREEYYHAICLAKYFFFTHACGFCRLVRSGQVRVQLWHGCGFKRENMAAQRHRYEYMTVVSKLYANTHKEMFGLDDKQMLITGYAKEDWLFHPIEDWQGLIGIPKAEKYIFWLPTFRSAKGAVSFMSAEKLEYETGLPIVTEIDEMGTLNEMLRQKDTVLIIKVHPLQKREDIFYEKFSNVVVLENDTISRMNLHVNQILGDACALISDYSSAAVDYLLLDRPIAFTLDDLEAYKQSRGFQFMPIEDWLPGEKITCFEEFWTFVDGALRGEDRTVGIRRKLRKRLHDFQDDQSRRRIVEALGII